VRSASSCWSLVIQLPDIAAWFCASKTGLPVASPWKVIPMINIPSPDLPNFWLDGLVANLSFDWLKSFIEPKLFLDSEYYNCE
jgi:hypothetical protein